MPADSPPRGTALVTGASRRIGRVVATDLARAGYAVAVHYNSTKAEAEAVVGAINAAGGHAVAIGADLAETGEVAGLVTRAAAALGPVTCLVNNASAFDHDSAATMTPASWDRHLDINLKAPLFLAQAMARELPPHASGNVVNIIDQRVWKLTPEFFSYTISKSGLWTATRLLAQELAPRIRVNAVGPGPVLKSVHQTDAEFASEQASTLLRRGPTPDEIAAAVRFILDAPSMTGQMIALDGGQHLT